MMTFTQLVFLMPREEKSIATGNVSLPSPRFPQPLSLIFFQCVNRSVFAYHWYTPPQFEKDVPLYFEQRMQDARKLHTGAMLTGYLKSIFASFFDFLTH